MTKVTHFQAKVLIRKIAYDRLVILFSLKRALELHFNKSLDRTVT